MAEYSISSEDDERVDAPTTSTPLLEITYVRGSIDILYYVTAIGIRVFIVCLCMLIFRL